MTATPEASPLRRLEITDGRGVVRAVLGLLDDDATGAAPSVYGLSLRDADGVERVALSVDAHGPTLVFVRGGNIAVQLGVDEPELPGDYGGAFLTLADARGAPLLLVSAEEDGSLQIRTAFDAPPEPP